MGNAIAPSYLRRLVPVPHRESVCFPCLYLAGSDTEHSAHEAAVSRSILMGAKDLDPVCTLPIVPVPSYHSCVTVVTKGSGNDQNSPSQEVEKLLTANPCSGIGHVNLCKRIIHVFKSYQGYS